MKRIRQWIRDKQSKVKQGWECPRCGEAHMDRLVWRDYGEYVFCDRCGMTYTPA